MTKKKATPIKSRVLAEIYSNPKYAGKHIIAVGDKILVASNSSMAVKIFAREMKKHPEIVPLTTYIPKEGTLILFL